jgi:hypothetical protein
MNVVRLVEGELAEETEVFVEDLTQCHLVYRKPHANYLGKKSATNGLRTVRGLGLMTFKLAIAMYAETAHYPDRGVSQSVQVNAGRVRTSTTSRPFPYKFNPIHHLFINHLAISLQAVSLNLLTL